jgi:hypothetical protein
MQINCSIRGLDEFWCWHALSFRRTAAQVNLSQLAVSGVITRLDALLGPVRRPMVEPDISRPIGSVAKGTRRSSPQAAV